MLSLLLLASAVAAQSVTIVTTHSGAQCKGDLTYEYTSFDPAGTCQGTTATQSCTNTQTSGSDSKFAGCFTTSGTVSPGGWVPPTDRASLASNSSYMTLTAYTSNTCSALPSSANSTVSQGFMQTTFAASGKCMSLDLAYFKASCTPSGGSLQFCT
nr:hypothetical protein HK105_004793 [Polyrhizophydium stewartii]